VQVEIDTCSDVGKVPMVDAFDYYDEIAFDVARQARRVGVDRVEMTWLSFGAGTQTAVLHMLAARNYMFKPNEPGFLHVDVTFMSDVGDRGTPCEWPETIDYTERLHYMSAKPIYVLYPADWNPYLHGDDGGLYDRYFARKTMPVRMMRSCTDNFKIRPQLNFMKAFYDHCAKLGIELRVRQIIGYSKGEEHRAARFDAEYEWIRPYFPLIEWGWSREETVARFAYYFPQTAHTIGLPEKSGCWFCPFQKRGKFDPVTHEPTPRSWMALYKEHPELFEAAVTMEEQQNKRRLKQGKSAAYFYGNRSLPDWMSDKYLWFQTGMPGIYDYDEGELATDDTCSSWGCFR
jgi:hypothetical protein